MPDFESQRQIRVLYHTLLILFDIVAFFAAWASKNIHLVLYVHVFGVLLTWALCVPDWKIWNRFHDRAEA